MLSLEYFVLFTIISYILIFIPVENRGLRIVLRIISYLLILAVIPFGFLDFLSLIFLGLAIPVSLLTSLYNLWYGEAKYRGKNLQGLIDVFNLSIIYTFAAPNMIAFISLWTLSEIVGFLLVSFEGGDEAFRAGYRFFFLKSMTFELSALTAVIILAYHIGIVNALLLPFDKLQPIDIGLIYSILTIIGFTTTAAIAPFHFWLPHAHSTAPSSGSAVLSGLTVKMGFYAIMRFVGFFNYPSSLWYIILGLGAVTAFYGFTVLLGQKDIKRLLAYSTMGNTGFMMVLLAIYLLTNNNLVFYALIANIYAHGLYKASLFLNTGTILVLAHTRDMTRLSALAAFTPTSSLGVLLTVLSVIGVPPTIGFTGKLLAIIALITIQSKSLEILGLVVTAYAILVSIIYGFGIMSIHWRAGTIGFKPRSIPMYPQIIELVLSTLSIIYGIVLLMFFNLGALQVLVIINSFSLLLVLGLVAVFYYNIKPRLSRELSVYASA